MQNLEGLGVLRVSLWSFLFVMLLGFKSWAEPAVFHICYFSFNNQLEVGVMQKLSERLNANQSNFKFTIKEYIAEGDEASLAFLNMVEKQVRCDGLVITGHHTGSFGGARAKGNLHIDFLENLVADPKFQSWFYNVRLLWLQGCRTLGVKGGANQNADSNTRRVGEDIDIDQLETDYLQLNRDFTTVFDSDNPIGERYRRVFQFATIFGWTQSAPSTKAESEFSLPVHIAHYSWLEGQRVKDPRYNLRQQDFVSMANSLGKMFKHQDQNKSAKAWLNAGVDKIIGFENQDVAAFTSLPTNLIEPIRKINAIQSQLRNYDPRQFIANLHAGLLDQERVGYLMSDLIYAFEWLAHRPQTAARQLHLDLKKEFESNLSFFKRLIGRVQNPKLGMITRLVALRVFSQLENHTNQKLDLITLKNAIKEEFAIKLPASDTETYRRIVAFRAELLRLMGDSPLLKDLRLQLFNSLPDQIFVEFLSANVNFVNTLDEEQLLLKLEKSPKEIQGRALESLFSSSKLYGWSDQSLIRLANLFLAQLKNDFWSYSFFSFLGKAKARTQDELIKLVLTSEISEKLRYSFLNRLFAIKIDDQRRAQIFWGIWQGLSKDQRGQEEVLQGMRDERRSDFLTIAQLVEFYQRNPDLAAIVVDLIMQKSEAGQKQLQEWIWMIPGLPLETIAEFANFEYRSNISNFNKRILGEHLLAYYKHHPEVLDIAKRLKYIMGPRSQDEFEELTQNIENLPNSEIYSRLDLVWRSSRGFAGEAELLKRLALKVSKESKNGVSELLLRSQQIAHSIEGFGGFLSYAWELSPKDSQTAQDFIFCIVSYLGEFKNKLQFVDAMLKGVKPDAELYKVQLELYLKHHGDDDIVQDRLLQLLDQNLELFVPGDEEDDEGPEMDAYLLTLMERFSFAPWSYKFLNKIVQKYAHAVSPTQMRDTIGSRSELTQDQKQDLLLRFVQKSPSQLRYLIWDVVETTEYRNATKIEIWMVPAYKFLLESYFLSVEEKNKLRFVMLENNYL